MCIERGGLNEKMLWCIGGWLGGWGESYVRHDGAVLDFQLELFGGEVGVEVGVPGGHIPSFKAQHGFDEEEVAHGVAHRLVDELLGRDEAGGGCLFDFLSLFFLEGGEVGEQGFSQGVAEEDSAVAVGLEVDAQVVFFRLVVDEFHARFGDGHGHAFFTQVACGGAVGVGSLHHGDLPFPSFRRRRQPALSQRVHEKVRGEHRHLVPIEEVPVAWVGGWVGG